MLIVPRLRHITGDVATANPSLHASTDPPQAIIRTQRQEFYKLRLETSRRLPEESLSSAP